MSNFTIEPKTRNQKALMDSIIDNKMTIGVGPAGTGKTFVSVACGYSLFEEKSFELRQIVLIRPNISTGRSLGSFPGDSNEKLDSWMAPLTDNIQEVASNRLYRSMLQKKQVVLQPLETIRGRSFEQALVIVDEAQNLQINEIKAIVTRIGEDSKMIILGDPDQSDIPYSGLEWLVRLVDRYRISDVGTVRFTDRDIVRSGLVGAFVRAFAKEKDNR